ncbi:MAG TPA: hypothetical protein EYP56_22050 [Planctomycetaceae bacterium]|nr:hypothetical protein [Planctomycetaceae bacterium]
MTRLRCEVVDAASGAPLAARVYVTDSEGRWLFARPASPEGKVVVYDKQRFERCIEKHTTVSAHPLLVDVHPGLVTVTVERGKEYLPFRGTVEVGTEPVELCVKLRRWIDMAAAGWYSGDTHVHRTMEELPLLLLAEDLNVGLPLTYWVTKAYTPPAMGDKSAAGAVEAKPIYVDATHVIYPVNTEYEIFSVGGKRHTLGAVFALGHRRPFSHGVPPVRPFAREARRQGALLDLDKHSWPWSLMLVPLIGVDLFELANNHCWRTQFGFRAWSQETIPAYMNLERDERGLTEWGWIDYGLQTYYALLNCGFRMKPSAGTASGVHPVPLGFGRVYVFLPDGFSYEKWMEGLGAGRSFVTTGPMLMVKVDGQLPGAVVRRQAGHCRITGVAASARPLRPIQIVLNGRAVRQLQAANHRTSLGGYESPIDVTIPLETSSWVAVRVFEERADQRVRFAHSSPVHLEVPGKPLRPRPEQVEFLAESVRGQLRRNRDVLPPEALEEYELALEAYLQVKPH